MAIRCFLARWLRTPFQNVPASPAATCCAHDHVAGSDLNNQYAIEVP
jgi:hypothetical protein